MNNGDVIQFDAKKNFTFVKPLGDGGTGETFLFKDETTDMFFAIKKYVPKDSRCIDEYYRRFVDEIKILFNISHPNIVRIYNYYLFPKAKTGFLQMEYVEGVSIDQFMLNPLISNDWNDIFREVITAFEYLEQNHILHRDIRPSNILINKNGSVKIIDFGFGKQCGGAGQEKNSILLNWPATIMPDEVEMNNEYNEQTEIYFVGTLFMHLLKDLGDEFQFQHILEKMIKTKPAQRYSSFTEITNDISAGVMSEINFSKSEKQAYFNFASVLTSSINYYIEKYSPINNVSLTLSRLEDLIRQSSLEQYLQKNDKLISCFISGGYTYSKRVPIDVQTIINFYELIMHLSPTKQKILFANIYNRLSNIEVHSSNDEMPF